MADGSSACAVGAGLVPLKTSGSRHPRIPENVVFSITTKDQRRHRLTRMRKTVLNSTRMLSKQRPGFRTRWAMATLTYAPDADWSARDVARFFKCMRLWFKRKGWPLEYVWVMELTKRGIPHYHCLIRLVGTQRIPKPDDVGWWQHGMTKVEWAKHAIGYLAKYASKGVEDSAFPKGARIAGNGGLDESSRTDVAFWNLPIWIREQMTTIERRSRIKGGFVNRATGEFFPTPYAVIFWGSVALITRKELPQ